MHPSADNSSRESRKRSVELTAIGASEAAATSSGSWARWAMALLAIVKNILLFWAGGEGL